MFNHCSRSMLGTETFVGRHFQRLCTKDSQSYAPFLFHHWVYVVHWSWIWPFILPWCVVLHTCPSRVELLCCYWDWQKRFIILPIDKNSGRPWVMYPPMYGGFGTPVYGLVYFKNRPKNSLLKRKNSAVKRQNSHLYVWKQPYVHVKTGQMSMAICQNRPKNSLLKR